MREELFMPCVIFLYINKTYVAEPLSNLMFDRYSFTTKPLHSHCWDSPKLRHNTLVLYLSHLVSSLTQTFFYVSRSIKLGASVSLCT